MFTFKDFRRFEIVVYYDVGAQYYVVNECDVMSHTIPTYFSAKECIAQSIQGYSFSVIWSMIYFVHV